MESKDSALGHGVVEAEADSAPRRFDADGSKSARGTAR